MRLARDRINFSRNVFLTVQVVKVLQLENKNTAVKKIEHFRAVSAA
jgi:hypothetical protein